MEENSVKERLAELADRSYKENRYTFTDFFSMAELSEFYEERNKLMFATPKVYGGCENAERAMIRFGNPEALGYEEDFPIVALEITPLSEKFADDFTHRDFLGAIMNLGIKRNVIGDIYVKEKKAVVFCRDNMAEYISDNLTRVKRTVVSVKTVSEIPELNNPKKAEKVIQVASERIDAVVSRTYNLSRNGSVELFMAGNVYLNGRQCTENAVNLKAGDVVSVRGYGKFIFEGSSGLSKKGKINCRISLYV